MARGVKENRIAFTAIRVIPTTMFRSIVCLIVFMSAASLFAAKAEKADGDKGAKHRAAQVELFKGMIPTIQILLSEDDIQALHDDARRYVEGKMVIGDKTYKGVALKLKGASGSFRPIDQKPAWTVNLDKFKGAERFQGLTKFHLNNAMEDPSFLHQVLCGEMARAAGVPAIRCTHALVKLNDRDLGLYVLTESYTKDFLAPFFKDTGGDLYESGFVKDIDEELTKDEGDKKDFSAIQQLSAASRVDDNAERWKKLGEILDRDRFASFLAIEALLGVGDGYDFGKNNYRIYQDPTTKLLSFIPHGMDEPLAEVDFGIQREPGSLVGRAFVGCPEGRALYRERVATIYEKVFAKRDWSARAMEVAARVLSVVKAHDADFAKELAPKMENTAKTVGLRVQAIASQLADMPEPLAFDKTGSARLTKGWGTKNEGGAKLDRATADGQACLRIAADGDSQASWRAGAALPQGRYRFEAKMKTLGVEGDGAGLRISGKDPTGEWVSGNSDWRVVNYEFEVGEDRGEVVLVAELRGRKGEARFAVDSLRLVRLARK